MPLLHLVNGIMSMELQNPVRYVAFFWVWCINN